MPDREPTSDLGDTASQAMLGANPFIGFRGEDVLATAGALTKERARFVRELVTDALAPSNSLAKPAALKRALETGGTSVIDGLRHMLSDLSTNNGRPSMVDKSALKVGENLATSEG